MILRQNSAFPFFITYLYILYIYFSVSSRDLLCIYKNLLNIFKDSCYNILGKSRFFNAFTYKGAGSFDQKAFVRK